MADLLTPHFGYPYPNPDDPLGGVDGTIEALALAIESFWRGRLALGGTQSIGDTTVPPSADTWTNLTSGAGTNFTAGNLTNGRALVAFTAEIAVQVSANVTRQLWLGVAIYEGPSSSPGSLIMEASDDRAIMVEAGNISGVRCGIRASTQFVSATLIPGNQYHLVWRKKVNSTTSLSINIGTRHRAAFTR